MKIRMPTILKTNLSQILENNCIKYKNLILKTINNVKKISNNMAVLKY